jgi:tripartite-type tricarboxylate transporter receptor subunit TctC
MKRQSLKIALITSIACIPLFGTAALAAEAWPTKPIRLVVPFTPGGSTDILARIVGQRLYEAMGQQVIIDNRPGAGGTIGMEMSARAAPDGYTLVMAHIGTLAVNPALYAKLSYDPVKDFEPVTLLAKIPNMMAVNPALPVKTVKELIALARTKPGGLTYGSGGNGSAAHLATEYFKLMAKVDLTHVPYRGTAPGVTDLIAGQINMMLTGVPPLIQHVKGGKLRGIAVATAQRLPLLPDLPTIAEAAVPGYEATQWYGILTPAKTSRTIVTRLYNEIAKGLERPEVRERLAADAAQPVGNKPEEFAAFIKSEIARWAPVVKASGARAD